MDVLVGGENVDRASSRLEKAAKKTARGTRETRERETTARVSRIIMPINISAHYYPICI